MITKSSYNDFCWPDECIDMLNEHWLVDKKLKGGMLQWDVISQLSHEADDCRILVNNTLDYLNGKPEFLKKRNKYTVDDAKKVLAMMDKIVEMYIQHIKTKRKNEILDCAEKYET